MGETLVRMGFAEALEPLSLTPGAQPFVLLVVGIFDCLKEADEAVKKAVEDAGYELVG